MGSANFAAAAGSSASVKIILYLASIATVNEK
jgi:hypothetical protein